jgi:hypothetical protein
MPTSEATAPFGFSVITNLVDELLEDIRRSLRLYV